MDGAAVQRIEEIITDGITREVEGLTFSTRDMKPIIFEPRPTTLKVRTLTGLVDYIQANIDGLDKSELILQVVSHTEVRLIKKLNGKYLHRDENISAVLDSELEKFPFGQWVESEAFIIKLSSMFEPTEDCVKLLQLVGKLTVQNGLEAEDDGLTQKANIRIGISGAVKGTEKVKPIVNLRPYRTFRELEQVESSFLFRMKAAEGKIPVLALFEADGGAWRNFAIIRIKQWLQEYITDIQIIA